MQRAVKAARVERASQARRSNGSPKADMEIGGSRRNTELFLLCLGAIPVILLYAMYMVNSDVELSLSSLSVPIGLFVAFALAHLAIRKLAPAADPAILPIVFVLSGIGITFVTRLAPSLASNQVMWLFLSVVVMVVALFLVRDLDALANYKYTIGLCGVILLFIPMIFGTEKYGSKLWISIGGLSFQPGELAKICIILFLAFYLASNREAMSVSVRKFGPFKLPRLRMLLPVFVMVGLSLLIVVFEKDLGSALLFFSFFVIMLYVATGRMSYVVISFLLLAVGGVACYFMFSHVQTRIDVWLDPWADPSGSGYQIVQSLYSIADGGLTGTGIGNGLPTYIPVVESDFIFSAICEELGLLGAAAVLILYLLFGIRGFATAARAKSDSSAFAAVGLTSAICIQAILIVGGNTGFLPLTGVTLPFMSQGGSSLVSSFIIVALLLRGGDEATGQEALIDSAAENESARIDANGKPKRDPVVSITGQFSTNTGTTGAHAAPGKHSRTSLDLQTPESGVLGRVALSRRLTLLITAYSAFYAALIANLTYIQVFDADRIKNLSTNNHTIVKSSKVQRGSIITSDGVTLAESVQQDNGTYERSYPQGSLAQHVVGYFSTTYGSTGIEASMNDTLTGKSDYSTWTSALYSLAGVQTAGSSVALTINSQIQSVCESALEDFTGAIVILNPSTGAVLAMASNPTYSFSELESVISGGGSELVNRATQSLYSPGSSFKAVTLSAAIDSGTATLDSVYSATSTIEIDGKSITNINENDYGDLTLLDAFAVSSNTAYGQLGVDVGPETLVTYSEAFGYNSSLGQDFSVSTSLMPDPDEMSDWETAWAACGQPVGEHDSPAGPQTTVMQNAVVAAAIANDGVVMNPYVVDHVLSPEGAVLTSTQARSLGQAISADTAASVTEAMIEVVDSGTGTAAQVSGVTVAGKTGTAEVDNDNINSHFIGFAPAESPTLAISVIIEGNGDDVSGYATRVAGNVIEAVLAIQASGNGY